ncbi:hypothetical protein NP233_g8484 [Leucocoprinus birnbaumii]|uniref:Uncharacterized protein n=1 Tax=Leucocoprinus birnbaumii TaxID=56174 RepID=A0AAD5VMH5_9AGAR|nr:hypothetical protein NP233_g8484 [Leucocoprinus birnbaumii]
MPRQAVRQSVERIDSPPCPTADQYLTQKAPTPPDVIGSSYAYTPLTLVPRMSHPSPTIPSGGILQLAPRQPICLPEVKVPFEQSIPQLPRGYYVQGSTNSVTQFDQADYRFGLDVIFREDSQFLNTKAAANVPPNHSTPDHSFSNTVGADASATEELTISDQNLGTLYIRYPSQTDRRESNAKLAFKVMSERFGCRLTPRLIKEAFGTHPYNLPDPLSLFDARQPRDFYLHKVRLWATRATGTTIFEEILRALGGTYSYNAHYTLPYFWPRINTRETTIQQREIRKCKRGHFQIVMSDQPFSDFYRPKATRMDKTEYQIAFRVWFLKLINERRDAYTAFVLATILNTDKIDSESDIDAFVIRY